jgi:hypothetical protein
MKLFRLDTGDHEPRKLLANSEIPTEPFARFMEDPKMCAIAEGSLHRSSASPGPDGWDRYTRDVVSIH